MQTIKQKIKSFIPQITKHLAYSTIAVLVGITSVYAIGSLTPTGTPGDNTQYSLNDIYTKLTYFTTSATEGSGAMVVPGTVSATFRTLSEIYALLEAEEANIVPEKILAGTTIFGVEGVVIEGSPALEWSTFQGNMDWNSAELVCAALTEGGATAGDWRLPNISELLAAVAYDKLLRVGGAIIFIESPYQTWSGNGAGRAYRYSVLHNAVLEFNISPIASLFNVYCVR